MLASAAARLEAVIRILKLTLVAALLAAPSFAQDPLDVASSEGLVRQIWFEGLPRAEAVRIGPAGSVRLTEMLADPAESAHHANILMALAYSDQPGAYEAIESWAATPREGELDRASFRAWQTLPHAWGELALRDPRALAKLGQAMQGEAPAWSFRGFRGERLARMQQRAAATSLGATGLPEAAAMLELARSQNDDPAFAEHLQEAGRVHAERAAERSR